jgi:hypothetical protein
VQAEFGTSVADPLVYLANRDATEAKESIHTHYNENIAIVDNSPSLVGHTDEAVACR